MSSVPAVVSPWVLVATGSALGGISRHAVGVLLAQRFGAAFPWGTLTVNVIGSFAIGVCGALLAAAQRPASPMLRDFLMIGFLGGFTTFSAFSLQTLQLLRDGRPGSAAANVLASLLLCLLAVWLGFVLAMRFQAQAS
jgi:CrcB protein